MPLVVTLPVQGLLGRSAPRASVLSSFSSCRGDSRAPGLVAATSACPRAGRPLNRPVHTISYVYDAAGQLIEAGDTNALYEYTHDGLGRVTQIEADLAALTPLIVLTQTHDVLSNRTSLATTIGGTADFKNEYLYDNLSRLKRVTNGA